MSVHRHAYGPALTPGYLLCANRRHGCEAPQVPDPAFGRPAPAVRDSETSQEAARAQGPTKMHKDRTLVYQALLAAPGGLTDEEIMERTGLLANTARPRRVELVADGSVVAARDERGNFVKKRGKSGSQFQVWVIAL